MPSPEIESKLPPEQVKQVETRFQPEAEKRLQEIGAQIRPQSAGHVTDDQGRTVAQSTDPYDQTSHAITIPVDKEVASRWAHGNAGDSRTWLGKYLLRKIALAVHSGFKIIIGKS